MAMVAISVTPQYLSELVGSSISARDDQWHGHPSGYDNGPAHGVLSMISRKHRQEHGSHLPQMGLSRRQNVKWNEGSRLHLANHVASLVPTSSLRIVRLMSCMQVLKWMHRDH